MKQIPKKLLILLSCLCLLTGFGAWAVSDAHADSEELKLTAQGNEIIVSLPAEISRGTLIRFHANEYHSSAEFIERYDGVGDDNLADGYTTDRNYYSLETGGFAEASLNGRTSLKISRYSDISGEEGWDKVFDKFYVVEGGSERDGKWYGGTVLVGPVNVTEFDSRSTEQREEPASIKGLEVVNCDDAEKLGVRQGIVGLDINRIQTSSAAADAIPYEFCGETYYFSQKNLRSNDEQIREMTDAGIQVTQSLLIYASNLGGESLLGHPDFEPLANFEMNMSGINTTTFRSVRAFAATCSFLADRYSGEDGENGRVYNYVVGNEVESACQWYNMGYLPIDEFVRQYERAVRIAYVAVKSVWSEANVLLCCSHFWNVDVATQYMNYDPESYRPFLDGHGAYTTRAILTEFARTAKEAGDYDWKLAYHPYRANAIGESVFWNAENYVASAHDEETAAKVTPLNIDVLADFLKKEEIAYEGNAREYYVTEYGAGTPHGTLNAGDYDPAKISDQSLNEQVASYIYSYYMFYFNGAKSYLLHRQIDVSYESGENMGLWFRQAGSESDLYGKKPLWEVFRYIDTEYSLQYTTPYLKYITKYPSSEVPKSWSEIIPGFDARKLERAPVEECFELTEGSYDLPEGEGFESGETGGWRMTDAATSAIALQDAEVARSGKYGLLVSYESVGSQGRGLAEKGIRYDFDQPSDLTAYDSFRFSIAIAQETPGLTHTVKVRFYSGDLVAEFSANIAEGEYVSLSAPIDSSAWEGFRAVDHIKIWYSSDSTEAKGGMLYFDDIGFSPRADDSGQKAGCGAVFAAEGLRGVHFMAVFLLAAAGSVGILRRKRTK